MEYNLVADKKQTIRVGRKVVISSVSPVHNNLQVVFEDDKKTGYFYALDSNYEQLIIDARHIYDVKAVTDRNIPSEIVIAWSKDGNSAILFINNYPHAVMDFDNKHGFCRSGFPPRPHNSPWSVKGHEWDEKRYNEIVSGGSH
ncbi:MAG: DUF2251 domain-containing protein [Chitinispirillia bacterium]|nr:DUF2251 domain-containing protein [Chitinispirillia bacterium]MCL2269350.1 DUF2251 domain-containing protein [Chitinispirillia bacterium]